MKFESFLENIYFGKLDHNLFHYDETPVDDAEAAELVKKFNAAVKNYPPVKIESLGRVPDELLEKLKKIGFFGLIISREYGGLGLSLHQYLAVIERAADMDMAIGILALAHLSIGVKGIILFGNEEQKKKYLTQAASGKMIFCYALTEPLIGSDAKNIQTTAELSDDGKYYILNGTKTFITNANYSGGLTLFAQMDKNKPGKLGAFIVETAWKGVTIGKDMEKMGLKASSTASIQLKDVRAPVENLIGKPGDGFKIAMTILNYGRLALGAASSGMMSISYADMVSRAMKRIQFGHPLIDFELIREKIMRAYIQKEVVSAMTNLTAELLKDNPAAPVAIESSHCKLYGTNRAWETLYDAMQLAGGSGYLSASPYEKRMRDFRVTTIFEGTTEIHSIYPPLNLARNVAKILKDKNPAERLLFIALNFLKPAAWKIPSGNPVVRKAAQEARHYAGMFRRLFLSGFVRLGQKLQEKEYLLRRLTAISYYTYGLLALISKIQYLESNGRNTKELTAVLDYYREEARFECGRNNHLKPDKKENKQDRLFKMLGFKDGIHEQ